MKRWRVVGWVLVFAALAAAPVGAQDRAGVPLEFEVASVRQNKSDDPPHSNFPLNPGPQYGVHGGLLTATNMVLLQYIVFAYKMNSYQIQAIRQQLPDWTRSAHYDIQARVEGDPTKDEMRVMMRKLLEARFHMRVHHVSREVPVLALELAKPGRTGPTLQPHPEDDPDCKKKPLAKQAEGGYPPGCGAGASMPAHLPNLTAIGGQKVTMADFVLGLTNLANGIDRPVVDRTGLKGAYDFTLEWLPNQDQASPMGAAPSSEQTWPMFNEALQEQMGLKLVHTTAPIDVIVLDDLQPPSEN